MAKDQAWEREWEILSSPASDMLGFTKKGKLTKAGRSIVGEYKKKRKYKPKFSPLKFL